MLKRCNTRVYVDLKFDHKHLLVFFRKNIKIKIKSCMFPVFLPLFRASGGCFRQSSAQHLWLPSCHVLKRWEGRKARFKFGQPTLAAQLEMLTKTWFSPSQHFQTLPHFRKDNFPTFLQEWFSCQWVNLLKYSFALNGQHFRLLTQKRVKTMGLRA